MFVRNRLNTLNRRSLRVLLSLCLFWLFANSNSHDNHISEEIVDWKLPPDSLLQLYDSVQEQTHKISKKCKTFIAFTVSVESSISERHHLALHGPNIEHIGCAVFILLHNLFESQNSDKNTTVTGISVEQVKTILSERGWIVISDYVNVPFGFDRRLSRYPKLNPRVFFPFTETILYADTKILLELKQVKLEAISSILLQGGASFGIVQHEHSSSLLHEVERIRDRYSMRPLTQSLPVLEIQLSRMLATIPEYYQQMAGIEGKLFASRFASYVGNNGFHRVWLDEYSQGSDRDQIAFYGACFRYRLKRKDKFPCERYNRAGNYESEVDTKFTMNILCSHREIIENAKRKSGLEK